MRAASNERTCAVRRRDTRTRKGGGLIAYELNMHGRVSDVLCVRMGRSHLHPIVECSKEPFEVKHGHPLDRVDGAAIHDVLLLGIIWVEDFP